MVVIGCPVEFRQKFLAEFHGIFPDNLIPSEIVGEFHIIIPSAIFWRNSEIPWPLEFRKNFF